MSDETEKKVVAEDSSRSFGQILADAGVGALRSAARGGGVKEILAGGVLGAIEGDEVENERKRRQAREAKQDILLDQQIEANKRNAEYRAEDQAMQKKTFERQQEEYEKNKKRNEMSSRIAAINLAMAEEAAEQRELDKLGGEFDKIAKASAGFDNMTFAGQQIFDKSPEVKAAREMYIITKLYDQNPDLAMKVLAKSGLQWGESEKGERGFYIGENRVFLPMNEKTMAAYRDKVFGAYKNALEAAQIMGTPAYSANQASLKNILSSKSVKQLFGDDYASALGTYRQFIQQGLKSGRFSSEDMAGHILSRNLTAAFEDGTLTQEEISVLAPQVATMLGKFGAEIVPAANGSIKDTKIRINGAEIDITKVASDLKERDVVMGGWNQQLKALQAKNNENNVSSEDALPPEELVKAIKLYGDNFNDLDPAVQVKVIDAQKTVNTLAQEWGAMKDGNVVEGVSDATLDRLVATEKNLLKEAAGDDSLTGFWANVQAERRSGRKISEEKKNVIEARKNLDAAIKADGDARKNPGKTLTGLMANSLSMGDNSPGSFASQMWSNVGDLSPASAKYVKKQAELQKSKEENAKARRKVEIEKNNTGKK
jgi:hypothetical protein